jgi:Domain of unknown function (DUF4276)
LAVPVEHIDLLVEEPSMEAALSELVPKIRVDLSFDILVFPGKDGLLARLPAVMQGYRTWLPANRRIIVLVDQDDDDCRQLKRRIEGIARNAGLRPKATQGPVFQVLTRIAIEELEAWYFGDVEALMKAYPGVPSSLGSKRRYRSPDAIAGGTWEALQYLLRDVGYYPAGLPKIEVAREVARHMVPDRNRSPSFCAFRDALRSL